MKVILKVFLSLLILTKFNSCNKESPVETIPNIPDPPVQINEYDLVGLEGEAIISVSICQKEPWRLAAITFSGTYISNDYGKNWKNVLPHIASSLVLWDPIETNIVYNAIRLQTDSLTSKYGSYVYLLKSIDYGYTWIRSDSGINYYDMYIRSLAIDPLNNDVLFAGKTNLTPTFFSSGDVFKTSDGGKSWISLAPTGYLSGSYLGRVINIEINAQTPQTLILTHNDYSYFRSIDGGKTWHLKSIVGLISRLSLGRNSNLALATIRSGLLMSKNAGESFETVNYYPFNVSNLNDVLIDSDNHLFVSTKVRSADTSLVLTSKDQAATWSVLGTDIDTKTLLDFDSKNNFLYVVMDGVKKGLYRYKLK
jgi:photosystem II stability/assembly factor-like uncharacterized protein